MKYLEIMRTFWKSFYVWVVASALIVCVCIGVSLGIDYIKRSNDVKKSGLQTKLLWNNIGQCFYAELDDFNKYYKIIRVEDCDKTK
jgi:hypothetical protein